MELRSRASGTYNENATFVYWNTQDINMHKCAATVRLPWLTIGTVLERWLVDPNHERHCNCIEYCFAQSGGTLSSHIFHLERTETYVHSCEFLTPHDDYRSPHHTLQIQHQVKCELQWNSAAADHSVHHFQWVSIYIQHQAANHWNHTVEDVETNKIGMRRIKLSKPRQALSRYL